MRASNSHRQILTRDEVADTASVKPIKRSPAQRQRAYRARLKRAATEAIGNEASASRVALLTLLADKLAALEARATPHHHIAPARNSVKRILNAIVTRYAIDLRD
jgi:hypothetical protein